MLQKAGESTRLEFRLCEILFSDGWTMTQLQFVPGTVAMSKQTGTEAKRELVSEQRASQFPEELQLSISGKKIKKGCCADGESTCLVSFSYENTLLVSDNKMFRI